MAMKGGGGWEAAGSLAPVVMQASNPLGGAGAGAQAPATSWTRCTRLQTGQVYFYNSVTGETQWLLPPGGVVVAEISQ